MKKLYGLSLLALIVVSLAAGCGRAPRAASTPTVSMPATSAPAAGLTSTIAAEIAYPPPSHTPRVYPGPPTATVPPRPTPTESAKLDVIELTPPLLVDSAAGRLYATGHIDGESKTVVLSAEDGGLLDVFDVAGPLGLDSARGRLYVDQRDTGLAVLDAATGEVQATIPLPAPSNEYRQQNPAPQADPERGRVLAFRDNVVQVIDP